VPQKGNEPLPRVSEVFGWTVGIILFMQMGGQSSLIL